MGLLTKMVTKGLLVINPPLHFKPCPSQLSEGKFPDQDVRTPSKDRPTFTASPILPRSVCLAFLLHAHSSPTQKTHSNVPMPCTRIATSSLLLVGHFPHPYQERALFLQNPRRRRIPKDVLQGPTRIVRYKTECLRLRSGMPSVISRIFAEQE